MSNRILIVDDETNVRLNLRTTLETEGYEIVEASSGQEAVTLACRAYHCACDPRYSNAWNGRIGIARQDAGERNQGPSDDRYGIQ